MHNRWLCRKETGWTATPIVFVGCPLHKSRRRVLLPSRRSLEPAPPGIRIGGAKWPCVIPGGICGKALKELDGTGPTEFVRKAGGATKRGASPRGYLHDGYPSANRARPFRSVGPLTHDSRSRAARGKRRSRGRGESLFDFHGFHLGDRFGTGQRRRGGSVGHVAAGGGG